MATIADVAKEAGLSRATVSRVINNYQYVSDEKRFLVQEAMKALNYFPNSSAQKLRSQRTQTIGVLIPVLTNPFFAYLLEGIDRIATDNAYQLLVCQTKYDQQKEIHFLNYLKSKQVDGIILTSIENNWETIAAYTTYGPIVLCNEYSEQTLVPMVRLNQLEGSYLGTCHLIRQGHRKIAYCRGGYMSQLTKDRHAGYKKALTEFGIPYNNDFIFKNVYDLEDGKKVLRDSLAMENPPTAFFAGSDQVATGIVKEAMKQGKSVPGDIAVIGFDDQPIASVVEPALTTIKQPAEEIGYKAMEVMIKSIESELEPNDMDIHLPLQLIVRHST
ncbi:LacI family transcriptional regulator [Peribacillus cavernae]|uniref:LacI family transcriptional regulator n=1 Tax=Peribacillus cavernae TaxID=1674310 RepID=A0A3S0VX50_9BACI|nr:LacI family DNA-binding transcriptional regulator [Peribacillus cavernae]MDQ0220486.1 DNA-binding LacI/PurR family transcriptional regulator [Peribacillus cavernae]RUQ28017.1 LacI family transcriptional regulator [Peribacillus cavernae]